MRQRSRKPDWQVQIAKERTDILLRTAKKVYKQFPERARRYIQLARKIGMRYNVRLGKEQKKEFCKKCNSLLVPGYSSSVRLDPKTRTVIIKCLNCKTIYRHPYK